MIGLWLKITSFCARVPIFNLWKFPPRDILCQGGILYYLVNYPQIRSSLSNPPPLPHSSLISRLQYLPLLTAVVRFIHFLRFTNFYRTLVCHTNFTRPKIADLALGSAGRLEQPPTPPPQSRLPTPQAKTIILKSLKPTYPSQCLQHKQIPGANSFTVPLVPLLQSLIRETFFPSPPKFVTTRAELPS